MKNMYDIKYRLSSRDTHHDNCMAENDVLSVAGMMDNIVSIRLFSVDGHAVTGKVDSPELIKFCDSHSEYPILYTSMVLMSDYAVEPSDEEKVKILDSQEEFVLQNGFISINDFVGYESQRAYIYNNGPGQKILDAIAAN